MPLLKSKFLHFVNPVYIGDRPASEMKLSILKYDFNSAEMKNVDSIEELIQNINNSSYKWVNVSGLKDIDSIKHLCELLEIHPLTIEDILHTEQQAKMEIFDEYRFLSFKTIQKQQIVYHTKIKNKKTIANLRKIKRNVTIGVEKDELIIDQISIIIKDNMLITFQELSRGSFDNIRKKILDNTGDIRKMETDYIAYLIIDKIVDDYFLYINDLEEQIENFEDHATQTKDNKFIEKVQKTKKYLMQIKRAILPLKDTLISISNNENFFKNKEIKPFLQDLNENLNQAITTIGHYREWLSNIIELNLSVLSHQMNKIMKVFTMISTIFIPLTFIAGIYGMNFEYMPELGYKLSYPIVLCVMGSIGIIMIIVFKVHRWF